LMSTRHAVLMTPVHHAINYVEIRRVCAGQKPNRGADVAGMWQELGSRFE
jgi:hypothetical protein